MSAPWRCATGDVFDLPAVRPRANEAGQDYGELPPPTEPCVRPEAGRDREMDHKPGGTGRPLSGLWRSDILAPNVVVADDRLITHGKHHARRWQWPAASTRGAKAIGWLQAVTGTRLDQQGLPVALSHAEWCEQADSRKLSATVCVR